MPLPNNLTRLQILKLHPRHNINLLKRRNRIPQHHQIIILHPRRNLRALHKHVQPVVPAHVFVVVEGRVLVGGFVDGGEGGAEHVDEAGEKVVRRDVRCSVGF